MLAFTFADPFNGKFVEVNVTGSFELNRIYALIAGVKERCDELGCNKALVDLSDILPPMSEMDRYFSGERVAEVFRSSTRIATLGRSEDITRFGETVAVNRGASFQMFSVRQEAIDWLLAD